MELLCRILHVSESGYYRYLKNLSKPSKDALLSAAIDRIMNESDYNDNYGVERMQLALEQNGFHTGERRIRQIYAVLRRILCKRYSTNVKNGAVFCACAGLNSLGYRSPVQALQYARPQVVNAARACREAYSLGIR